MNENVTKSNLTFGDKFVRFFDRWTPNSMVFAYILTIIVAILAIIFTDAPLFTSTETQSSLVDSWVGGFWGLLTFAMQMSLIMITGNIIAISPPVQKIIKKVARIPNNWKQALILNLCVAAVINFIHWGIGMMVSIALLRSTLAAAREKGYAIHAPALVATSYCCALPAVGISQAAPLYGATPGYLASLCTTDIAKNYLAESYPLNETVLTGWNLSQCVVILIMLIVVGMLMMPKNAEKMEGISDELYADVMNAQSMYAKLPDKSTPANWMNNTIWTQCLIGGIGVIWCIKLFAANGMGGLTINNFNFTMLMLGFVLCGTPENFVKAALASVGAVWGVIIQYPLYAGIFGIITGTGLAAVISDAFMAISTQKTFPYVAYLYSAVLNMAVPSGGSKFIIECPYLLDVAAKLNVEVPKLLVAYVYGDQTTNIIQPFWALPFITMLKVDFKKMLPYTLVICIATIVICTIWMLGIY